MMQAGKDYGVRVVKPFRAVQRGIRDVPDRDLSRKASEARLGRGSEAGGGQGSNQAKPTLKIR
jgi:hypothetical protein